MCGLRREGALLKDTATLLVIADSVCTRRGDTSDSVHADRLMTFPGRQPPGTIATSRAHSHAVSRGP